MRLAPVLGLAALLAGCLPSSCRRTESRDVTPADSVSRRIAARITPDTLRTMEPLRAPEMAWPRTVLFAPDGGLFASDAERGSIYEFSAGGEFRREITGDSLAAPYIAGLRGDTLLVLNPEARRIDYLRDGRTVHRVHLPHGTPPAALLYAAAGPENLYLKVTGRDIAAYLLQFGNDGEVRARVPLSGSEWRHAGFLRLWGDTLLSLSGFFPTVYIAPRDLSSAPDSLALRGFDSPMLRRTYGFLTGSTRQAPLLSSSAAPAGDLLFVLNMRPGWLHIDVYDRSGLLRRVLVDGAPTLDKRFYPMDLAVRAADEGGWDIAVAVAKPSPEIRRYRWAGLP